MSVIFRLFLHVTCTGITSFHITTVHYIIVYLVLHSTVVIWNDVMLVQVTCRNNPYLTSAVYSYTAPAYAQVMYTSLETVLLLNTFIKRV